MEIKNFYNSIVSRVFVYNFVFYHLSIILDIRCIIRFALPQPHQTDVHPYASIFFDTFHLWFIYSGDQ